MERQARIVKLPGQRTKLNKRGEAFLCVSQGEALLPIVLHWSHEAERYARLVKDTKRDSHFLRDQGLSTTLFRLIGTFSGRSILDAGCADGWLLDLVSPVEGHGCDIVRYEGFPSRWEFRQDDVRNLSYNDAYFDLTVASLVLMWFPELDQALRELHRVTRPDGTVVIAIMNPYFYRTGDVDDDGNFVVMRDLSRPFVIEDHRIAEAVGPFPYHYRPLSTYLNECIRAGLAIEEIDDWHVDMEVLLAHFRTDRPGNVRRTGKVPMYTFIKCRRR